MFKREKFIPPSRDEVFIWEFFVLPSRDEVSIWEFFVPPSRDEVFIWEFFVPARRIPASVDVIVLANHVQTCDIRDTTWHSCKPRVLAERK